MLAQDCQRSVSHSRGESRNMPAGSLGPSALHDLRSTSGSEGRLLCPAPTRTPKGEGVSARRPMNRGGGYRSEATWALSAALTTAWPSGAGSPVKPRPAGSHIAPHLQDPRRCVPHQLLRRSLPMPSRSDQRSYAHPDPRHCRPSGQTLG